jgi:hypothetical protein
MKYRVRKKRMNQKSRNVLKFIRMRFNHPWSMANELKYYIRFANFPITHCDTIWTAYLRLKRIHNRQIQ